MKYLCESFGSGKHLVLLAVVGTLALSGCGDAADDDGSDGPKEFVAENNDAPDTGSPNNDSSDAGTSHNDSSGATGFGGQWTGQMECDYRKEADGEVSTDQQTVAGQANFDANGDLLLTGANGQPAPQDRQGLRVDYVPEGGGTASRELVLLQKSATTRHYEFRHSQNTTTYDSGASTTYDRQMHEVYDYKLSEATDQLAVQYDLLVETVSFFSSDAGSVRSDSREVLSCSGTLER